MFIAKIYSTTAATLEHLLTLFMICGNIFKFITNHNVNRWIIALASSFVHVICARCCFCCCRWFYCWFVASVGGGGVVGGVTKLAANHFATFIMHSCNIYSHEFIYICVCICVSLASNAFVAMFASLAAFQARRTLNSLCFEKLLFFRLLLNYLFLLLL